jgi:hypothetical protein
MPPVRVGHPRRAGAKVASPGRDDPACERCGLERDPGADESLAWMFSLYARDESGPQVERWVHRRRR